MITDIESLEEIIENSDELFEVREAARQLHIKLGESEAKSEKLCDKIEELEQELQRAQESTIDNWDHFQIKFQRLFTGDLSTLDYGQRRDLFDAIANCDTITLERFNNRL